MRIRLKRAIIGGNAAAAVSLAVLLMVATNYLAARHRVRFDFSPDRYYTLSEATVNMLSRLSVPVKVVVLLDMNHELFRDVKSLLKEYEYN
ncbi:MAG: Gldg family protein, partial [Kiritimatiellia bacterium]